jgi:RNA polymerase sigma factor (sigma-70 family)
MAAVQTSALLRQIRRLSRPALALTDRQLLTRFIAEADEPAFAELLARYGSLVLDVCRRTLQREQDAEDAFQAAFLVLARNAASIRKTTSLASWLYGVAWRCAMRLRADLAERRRHERVVAQSGDRSAARSSVEEPPDLTWHEVQQALHEELARLPEKYRAPLVLCYLQGKTQCEAAQQLGCSQGVLHGRVDRGREHMRQRLQRRGITLSAALLAAAVLRNAPASAALIQATEKAAMLVAAGQTVSAAATPTVAALVDGAGGIVGMKAKLAVLVLLAGIIGGTLGLASSERPAATDEQARSEAKPNVASQKLDAPKPGIDFHGDPLPDGAVMRFGSARWRHGDTIYASALSPDGKMLATAGNHSVMVRNLDTGKAVHQFACDRGSTFCTPGLAFSSDGSRLGYVRGSCFACAWDLKAGKELQRFERQLGGDLNKHLQGYCQFDNGGKELVLLSQSAIETWSLESGQQTASVPAKYTALLSPDGKAYVSIGEGATTLCLGDTRTGKMATRLEVAAKRDGIENGLAFSPDGKTIAAVHARKEIQVREVVGGKLLASFPLPDSVRPENSANRQSWDYRLTYSTDGKLLLLGTSHGIIHRWDLVAGKELPPLRKHYAEVTGMHTIADGRSLVSTSLDGVIHRWDLKTGGQEAEPESYEGKTRAAYSPVGRLVAIGDGRGRMDLWDGRTGKLVRTVQQEGTAVAHLAFAPDGKVLAAAERSGTVRFWDVPSGRPGAVWEREPEKNVWFCNGIHFSPDGRLLCVSDYPKQIRVLEVASGKLLWTGDNSYGEAFSPDGGTLLVAAPTGSYLTMLDVATGKKRPKIRLESNIPDGLGSMYELAFSPDGHRFGVALPGGSLFLCDGQTGTLVHQLAEHEFGEERRLRIAMAAGKAPLDAKIPNSIRAVAFSPDGRWFASAGTDRAIYIWETATGKEAFRLPGHDAEVSAVAFSPNGKSVFSYGQDGQGYLWSLKPKAPAGQRAALDKLWTDMAATDASKAYQAVWSLSDDPRAVSFLRQKIPPAKKPEKAHLERLIADLDSDGFEIRTAADRALAELGQLAAPALEAASKSASSPEQRKRLDRLLAELKKGLSPPQLQQLRAVQALELANSAEARQVLRDWAGGAPGARLTLEARAALDRQDKHKK